jgi:hypothetical protein
VSTLDEVFDVALLAAPAPKSQDGQLPPPREMPEPRVAAAGA